MAIKGYEDYLIDLQNEFPELEESSIKKVLQHGLNFMLKYRKRGVDFYIHDDKNLDFYMYLGDVTRNVKDRNKIYFKKKRNKLRHLYMMDKRVFDGYYYFSLTDLQFEKYNKDGIIECNFYYQLIEEAQLNPLSNHIYRVASENKNKWTFIINNDEESNTEYIQRRNDKGFESINNAK